MRINTALLLFNCCLMAMSINNAREFEQYLTYCDRWHYDQCLPTSNVPSEDQNSYYHSDRMPGEFVEMSCQSITTDHLKCCKPKMEIFHNGTSVDMNNTSKYLVEKSEGQVLLYLRKYSEEDAGNYTCRVTYQTYEGTEITQNFNILSLTTKKPLEFVKDLAPLDNFEDRIYWLPDDKNTKYSQVVYLNQVIDLKVKFFVPFAVSRSLKIKWNHSNNYNLRHFNCDNFIPLFEKYFTVNKDNCFQSKFRFKYELGSPSEYKVTINDGNRTLEKRFLVALDYSERLMLQQSLYQKKVTNETVADQRNSSNSNSLSINENDDVEILGRIDNRIYFTTISITPSAVVCGGKKFEIQCSSSPFTKIALEIVKLEKNSESLLVESPRMVVKPKDCPSCNTSQTFRIGGPIQYTIESVEMEMGGIYRCQISGHKTKGKNMTLTVQNCGIERVVNYDGIYALSGILLFFVLFAILIFKFCCRKRIEKIPAFCQLTEIQMVDTDSSPDSDASVHLPLIRPRIVRNGFRRRILYEIPCEAKWEIDRSSISLNERLGEGNFGEVFWGTLNNEDVAIKKLKEPYSEEQVISLLQEAEIMKRLGRHDNIISFIGLCPVHSDDVSPWLVMELAVNGSLRDFLRDRDPMKGYQPGLICPEVTASDMRKFALQVASGMEFITSKKVIHRDLAARNVLLTRSLCCKIADFGLTREAQDYYRFNQGPLPIRWLAPEALNHGIVTSKSDVWSYGICLWEIFSFGASPFPDQDANTVAQNISRGFSNRKPSFASAYDFEIMTQCWQSNPDDRPDFSELVRKLENSLRRPSDVTSGIGSLTSDDETVSYLDFGSYRTVSTRHSSETSNDSAVSFHNPSYVIAIASSPVDTTSSTSVGNVSPNHEPYYNVSNPDFSYYNVLPVHLRSVSLSSTSPDSVFERLNPIPENEVETSSSRCGNYVAMHPSSAV